MSLTQRIKQGFLRQPLVKKAILLSSATLMLSAVLPWYDNRNSFGIGDTYLAIQGPLFLVGYLVLGCGLISFLNMFLPLVGRKFFDMKKKGGMAAFVLGLQSLFAIVIANSVFYHPNFGTNVGQKTTRFGMLVAFASICVMVIAGFIAHKKEKAGKYDDIEDVFSNPVVEPQTQSSPSNFSAPRTTSFDNFYSPSSSSSTQRSVQPSGYQAQGSPESYNDDSTKVDPLTLDAKTRYRMMRSQQRYSDTARTNLWGSGGGSAFSHMDKAEEKVVSDEGRVSDGMKIRMDL